MDSPWNSASRDSDDFLNMRDLLRRAREGRAEEEAGRYRHIPVPQSHGAAVQKFRTSASVEGRAVLIYHCTATARGVNEYWSFEAACDDDAILRGIAWAREEAAKRKPAVAVEEVVMTRWVMGEKDDTFCLGVCFQWKAGGPATLEQEIAERRKADEAATQRLFNKLRELEAALAQLGI